MRRKDVFVLVLLGAVANASWQQLKPPPIPDDQLTIDAALLGNLTKWSGKLEPALAAEPSAAEGAVMGASTDNLSVAEPLSLLPTETYTGSPFTRTLEAMLQENNVTVHPEDVVAAFPAPELGLGSVIKVYRATPVEVTDWGKKKSYRTWAKTVQDFLDEQVIELGDNDRIEPSASKSLALTESTRGEAAVKLLITRVAITEVKVKEAIDFKRIEKEDPELPRGKTKVEKGAAGERTKVFKVTRENGVEVKRELLSNEITKQPKDEIIIKGTKVLIGKTYNGRASWYKYNSTKVASDLFKRGTELRITNLNNGKVIFVKNDGCICADTGYVVDLHPDHFTALGGTLRQGVLQNVKVEEILN